MTRILSIILFGLSILIYSQTEFEANNITVLNEIEGKLTIKKYSSKEIHKNKKCRFLENTPEQKFCVFFNLNTKKELNNFFKPYNIPSSYSKENYLDKMEIYNKSNNFYILDSKYIFDYGMSKDIFIKYINVNETFPKPIYSTFYAQDFSNKLIIKDLGENFDLGLFLITSNTSKTINYLNKFDTRKIDVTSLCNEVLDNIKSKSNKNTLFKLIDKKYSPFFNDKNESANVKVISEDSVNYNFKKTFHDIINGEVFKKNKISKKELSEKYGIPMKDLVKDSLSIKEIIKVNTMNNDFQIIKFYDSKPIIKTSYEVLDNDVIKNNSSLTVLMRMNFKVFMNIYSDRKSKKYPEINKLKPLVKDANGVLNIEKLAKVLKENKASLSKYLDE